MLNNISQLCFSFSNFKTPIVLDSELTFHSDYFCLAVAISPSNLCSILKVNICILNDTNNHRIFNFIVWLCKENTSELFLPSETLKTKNNFIRQMMNKNYILISVSIMHTVSIMLRYFEDNFRLFIRFLLAYYLLDPILL